MLYNCVKSKLRLSTAKPLLYDNNLDKTINTDFKIASRFKRGFQKVF